MQSKVRGQGGTTMQELRVLKVIGKTIWRQTRKLYRWAMTQLNNYVRQSQDDGREVDLIGMSRRKESGVGIIFIRRDLCFR